MINVRSWWVLGVAALILIGLAVNMSATTIHADVCPPEPMTDPPKVCEEPTEQKYIGDLEVVSVQCGGGTLSLTVNADGSAITMLVVDGAIIGGLPVNILSFPEGPFVIIVDPVIPIAGDGSFNGDFEPLTGVVGQIEGMLAGDTMTGTIGIALLKCAVGFSAAVPAEPTAEPTADLTAGPTDAPSTATPAGSPEATALPTVNAPLTGIGPASGSSNEALLWTLLAAGLGALALGTIGLAAVRRRDA